MCISSIYIIELDIYIGDQVFRLEDDKHHMSCKKKICERKII
jgi:hypothetical protein